VSCVGKMPTLQPARRRRYFGYALAVFGSGIVATIVSTESTRV